MPKSGRQTLANGKALSISRALRTEGAGRMGVGEARWVGVILKEGASTECHKES